MNLASSSEDLSFAYLKSLVRFINEHVDREEYAVMLKRIKKFKLEVTNKAWIICDRERKTHEVKDQARRHCDNKHIECSFFIIVKLDENIQTWLYEIKNPEHNHVSSIADSHSVLRRMTMTDEIKSDITRQLTVRTASFKVLFTLRLDEFANDDNSMIKSRDIYNLKAQLRRDDLESLTLIQILMRELDEDDWKFSFQKNSQNQLTHCQNDGSGTIKKKKGTFPKT